MSSNQSTAPHRVYLIILISLVFFLGRVYSPLAAEETVRVHFIDVGYGDAILIELPENRHVMIDAGEGRFSSRVIDYLRAQDIQSLQMAVITHPHINHFEGFFDILESIPVHHLYVNGDQNSEEGYEALLDGFQNKDIPVGILRRGDVIIDMLPALRLEVWHPKSLLGSPNANSLVLMLKHYDVSLLFMGDVGTKEQNELIELYPSALAADIIKVPHHGGPLSETFYRSFADQTFIISTGPNPWGYPRDDELQKLTGEIYRSDTHGTIVVESDGSSVTIKTSQ